VNSLDVEIVLVSLAAMLSPTTLTFSVLALVLGERPLRTGLWFWLGAVAATVGVGVLAALVLGDSAASHDPSTPKTWVAVLDVVFAAGLFLLAVHLLRSASNPEQEASATARMSTLASSPAIAIVAAGATLANPGAFIPIALKEISELDPSKAQYVVDWVFFTLVSTLPLAIAIVLLVVAHDWAMRVLERARDWLLSHARTVGAVIVFLAALALLRNGISGLKG
jgi:Na+/phosphate symporter